MNYKKNEKPRYKKFNGVKSEKHHRERRVKDKKKSFSIFQEIHTKLILGFLLPVCCIIVLGIISYQKAHTVIVGNYEKSISQTLDMTGQYFTFSLGMVRSQIDEFYTDVDINDYFAGLYRISATKEIQFLNSTTEALKKKIRTDDLLENVYILSSDNDSMVTTKADDEELYTKYMESAQGQKIATDSSRYYWFGSNNEMDGLLQTDSTSSALRLARKFKKGNTCVIADISNKAVLEILTRINMGESSIIGLVTEDGVEIIPDNEEDLSAMRVGKEPIFYGKKFYEEAITNEKENAFDYINYNNENYMFVYSKVGTTGAMICAMVPEANIIGQVKDIKNITFVVVVLASILALLTGSIISGDLSKAINYMANVLRKAAGGDFTVELKVNRNDELGILAKDLSNMITHVKGLIQEVKEVGDALFADANQVAISSKVYVESTDNIKQAISEIEEGIVQLDENSADCIGQMDSLSNKITLVANSTSQIKNITDATEKAIDSGILAMSVLNEKTKYSTEIMSNVIAAIKQLEEKSKSIESIIEVINEIAEETNLLSLNASIESARAGIYGRGFSVVADEIKKLSDQSKESTNQIRGIIEDILSNTAMAVKIAEQADVIVLQQESAVNNTTESFTIMDRQIELLMNELKSILNNIENMEHAKIKTSEAIMSISAVSEETTACTNTVSDTAHHQLDAATQLDESSSELLNRAKQLELAMNQFHI